MPSRIISIVILVIITTLVSGLMAFGYYSIIKTTRKLSKVGLLDNEFLEEDKKNGKRWIGITFNVISITLASVLVFLCGVGLIYRINNEQIVINNKTALVVSSDSMDSFYNDEYKKELIHNVMSYKDINEEEATKYLENSEFYTGDLLGFSSLSNDDNIALYEVYGYKNKKDQIITHRLVAIDGDKYIFRGDNTFANDAVVSRDQILYHYSNFKVVGVGIFVLFFSSSFGLYSIFITLIVMFFADIFQHRYKKIKEERLLTLGENKHAYQ